MPLQITDVKPIFTTHVTKFQQTPEKAWKWTCSCGQDKLLDTREMCVAETNSHYAAKIVELQPEETDIPAQEDAEAPIAPMGLAVLSYLVREVDCEKMSMPEARRAVGEWFYKQDKQVVREPGRARMRRLKQIVDAMNEEFMSLLGASNG